jgi:hypothetical protein
LKAALQVRASPNDQTLDRRSWVLHGGRVVERPTGISAVLDRTAMALARRRLARSCGGDVMGGPGPGGCFVLELPAA